MKNYALFEGRARRKEFWMFQLFHILFSYGFVNSAMSGAWPYLLYCLAAFIPSLAVLVRRLHDVNKSGWWSLIILIPIIGIIWLLVLLCIAGDKCDNQYGPDPKALEA